MSGLLVPYYRFSGVLYILAGNLSAPLPSGSQTRHADCVEFLVGNPPRMLTL